MTVLTRFAPSPTGYLHIGGARTALFNYLFAKNNGGKFLLRVEDTDQKRSTKEAISAISQGMQWLGLDYDEKEVFQSQNIARHKEIANKLLEEGKAYLCYTPMEELEELRSKAQEKNEIFRFQSPWRDKANSQSSTVKPVIRIKAPLEGQTIIKDLVQGQVTVPNQEIDDLIMLRSDETPTYMLAVVVDDHDMGITHVIRGDDHLTNAFRQKVIYEALGWNVPEFAHIPLIHGPDGAKMSKRHGATSVIDYKEMGYLPQAMRNYLLRLGWSHGDDEIISDQQAAQWFNIEKVGKSPARFDFAKLKFINKHYIKEKSETELFDLITFEKEPVEGEKQRILKAINFNKERAEILNDLVASSNVYFDGYQSDFDDEAKELISQKSSIISGIKENLQNIEEWNHDSVKATLMNFAKENSIKIKDFGPALRLILTFSKSSGGGIFDVVDILGKQEVVSRIDNALNN